MARENERQSAGVVGPESCGSVRPGFVVCVACFASRSLPHPLVPWQTTASKRKRWANQTQTWARTFGGNIATLPQPDEEEGEEKHMD